MKRATQTHWWQSELAARIVTVHVLERGRHGELDTLARIGEASAWVGECRVCGCVAAWSIYAVVHDRDGGEVLVKGNAFGVDWHSLAIMHHAPGCESLCRPGAHSSAESEAA